jgi:DNA-binding transcriptional LysR family regulator
MADRRLQVFHAVAKQLSFTKAAELLFMTQPAVTFQIKQLEEQLNCRLFERGHGRIQLTPVGALVLSYAERILSMTAEMETRIREMVGALSGPLLIGASTTIAEYVLPQILGQFKASHPDVQAKLTVGNSDRVTQALGEHSLDVGLIEGPAEMPSLAAEVLCEDELLVVVSPDHPLAAAAALSPDALLQHGYVSREAGSGTRDFTDLYLRQRGIDPGTLRLVMELSTPEALKGVVATGIGFAIMSRLAVERDRQFGRLRAIPLAPRLMRALTLVYPRERFRSMLVNTFIEFAKKSLRA